MVCNSDCLNCLFDECINDSDELSLSERKLSSDIDKEIMSSRVGAIYDSQHHKRQLKDVDEIEYIKARSKYFKKKYYYQDVEKSRRLGRENYHKNKEKRNAHNKEYYKEHREELLNQKKSYYKEHREEILEKRKASYVPKGKKPVKTDPVSTYNREKSKKNYDRHKDEINARRRERRRLLKSQKST